MVPKRYEGRDMPLPLISQRRLGYFFGGTLVFWAVKGRQYRKAATMIGILIYRINSLLKV